MAAIAEHLEVLDDLLVLSVQEELMQGVWRGHRRIEPAALEREGGAVVLLQIDLTPDKLATTVCALVADPTRLAAISAAAERLALTPA